MIRARNKEQRNLLKRRLIDLLGGKCVDCGYSSHLAALDFDHLDPAQKKFNIGAGLSIRKNQELEREAKKCVIRCANCHRIKTWPDATD